MATQGTFTRNLAISLSADQWVIAYTCIPNTPHLKAVPIPIIKGSSKQRYPDIVAIRGNNLLLVEVELTLTDNIAQDIMTRFLEMRTALGNTDIWKSWRQHVNDTCGVSIPQVVVLKCVLYICSSLSEKHRYNLELLKNMSIDVDVYDKKGF